MKIQSPSDSRIMQLCRKLADRADATDVENRWPAEQLHLCAESGVFEWFVPRSVGGQEWTDAEALEGYLHLSHACLTTTFILTQRTGACRRVAASQNEPLKARLMPDLLSGKKMTTVGISHLTTSRRHLASPVLRAEEAADGFVLDGYSPWVTGGVHSDVIVLGATLDDGRQILAAVPTTLPGMTARPPVPLIALSASCTGRLDLNRVHVPREHLLAGPVENVMSQGVGARTGGLETSCLAIGLAGAAIDFLRHEALKRPELADPAESLAFEQRRLRDDMFSIAGGDGACSAAEIRSRANSLALRATQASLGAAKGTGFVKGHPAGRWCREALFFLVWSCPQPVLSANLCELAGLSD